jgi:predicted murein hydrolase (TIGR00659 family)
MIQTFIETPLFLLALTIGIYCGGVSLYRRCHLALLHPTLLSFVAIIIFLKVCGIDYLHYRDSTRLLDFLLGMSVVALGYLLYEQQERLRAQSLTILSTIVVGSIVGIVSVVAIAALLGADHTVLASLAPKSVTIPIAVAISEPTGGDTGVTSIVVFLVGIFGSVVGPRLLRLCGIRNPMAQGLALGASAHGIGTARAIEMGAIEGAFSGLALALMGVVTAVLVPLILRFV